MGKTILLVHGRSWKPPKNTLQGLWLEALRHAIQRDFPRKARALNAARIEMVYYGHITNRFLKKKEKPRSTGDTADRRRSLQELKKYGADEFTESRYNKIRGLNPIKEAAADGFSALLNGLRLGRFLIQWRAPDMREYWNHDSQFGSAVRDTMIKPLRNAMDRKDKILVIAHSLGTMVAYDTFWKFSHYGEYRLDGYNEKEIDLWITLGSPLGDGTVKRNLKGARASGKRRYPRNVRKWVNVAAEDDYISHDEDLADDYHAMLRSIKDHRIYNLAIRHGKSNPHHAAGYLVHPLVARTVADWL